MKNLSIFINTFDSYHDCWTIFFQLFKKYFPHKDMKIYLNNGNRPHFENDLIIENNLIHDCEGLSWGTYLLKGLEKVNSEFIFYFQEDYFIEKEVGIDSIKYALKILEENDEISQVQFTNFGTLGSTEKYKNYDAELFKKESKYLVSTQAAIWRKSALLNLIDADDTGWSFEKIGSLRARKIDLKVLRLSGKYFSSVKYQHTGIIKGKWNINIKEVLSSNNIHIDYSKRGYYKEKIYLIRVIETIYHLIPFFRKKFLKILFKNE